MPKPRKKAAPEAPIVPRIGDKVTIPRVQSVLEVDHVTPDGIAPYGVPGTNLQWSRIKADTLTYVERKPPVKTSNPFTTPEPVFDVREILERISIVQEENLKRLDDDIDILKAYLKTRHLPKAAILALEGLTVEQHVPVCLSMTVDRSISANYKGKTFYFCSKGCKETFDKHTDVYDRFLAEDAQRRNS